MLFFTESDVRRLLPMREAIGLMRDAFSKLGAGEALNQPRRRLVLPAGPVLHSMAASYGKYFGTKAYSTHPRHGAYFLLLFYRAADARPLALFEANYLGQIRTGAASGLATDLMAPREADVVGVVGSGFQARSQAEAMAAVRPIREVRVWSRSEEKRKAFARWCEAALTGAVVRVAGSAKEAVSEAPLIVTATYSKEPVLDSAWVSPEAHVNAVGSNWADRRELPGELVRQASLIVVDSLEQARIESGDLLLALEDWNGVVELKDLVRARPDTRSGISIFKSNGLALEDVAAAAFVYEEGLMQGAGREIPVLTDYS